MIARFKNIVISKGLGSRSVIRCPSGLPNMISSDFHIRYNIRGAMREKMVLYYELDISSIVFVIKQQNI